MSGHSKWATTKHKKAVVDARRAKSFAKLIKHVEVAARMGGADVSGNPTLFDAIEKAKKTSVPKDNIERAVKRGAGLEAGAVEYETLMYEGYGPSGVALMVECLTDNRNRSASDVRLAMTRNGGTMANAGSVSYLFGRRGVVTLPKRQQGPRHEAPKREGEAQGSRTVSEDDLLEVTLDAGADEVYDLGESFEVLSDPNDLIGVRTAVQGAGLDYDSAEVAFVPSVTVEVDEETANKVVRLIEALEESDDVQNVYANFDVPDEAFTDA